MQIVLPEAYLSWPALGKPKVNTRFPDQGPRYSATFIFPKGTDLSELTGKIDEMKSELGKPVQHCCLKASAKDAIDPETGLVRPLYDKGDFYIQCWNPEDYPPVLCGPDRKPGYHAANFKGGNKVQAIINLWGSSKKACTIGAGIKAVQWRGDGEQIGSGAPNLNLFTEVSAPQMTAEDLGI